MQSPPLDLSRIFVLEPHGPDTFVGQSPPYYWGRIYGGLVIAQALWAAVQTVRLEHAVHSLHAYFILGGDPAEPVRYEVDRLRNGRSFTTRQVTARQSGGAILTLSCSFQAAESGAELQSAEMPPGLPEPETLAVVLDAGAERCDVPAPAGPPRSMCWVRFPPPLDPDPRLPACALAYLSDVNTMTAVGASYPSGPISDHEWRTAYMSASLDHAVWFHRPVPREAWLLLDLTGHGVIGSRGLATGSVFARDGTHVATVAQEGVIRPRR